MSNNCTARNDLLVALHTLASHFENALYAFGDDDEARKKAEGDIAWARLVASRHNYNGSECKEIERLREELDSLGKAFVVAINAASDDMLKRYCDKQGWDFDATKALGRPVAVITDPELVRVLNLDTRDTDIQRFEKALMACQKDREEAWIREDRLRELLRSVSVRLALMRGPSLLKGPEDRLIAEVMQEIEGALGDD